MQNFDRQYRFSAGQAGGAGFEIGDSNPIPLHINFSIEKSDVASPNTAKISLWNLSPANLSTLNEKDCVVTLKAGYATSIPLAFVGTVTNVVTELDGADTRTDIEATDSRKELRDSYLTLSYLDKINSKKIVEDAAGQMGLPITFSEQTEFLDFPCYSFVGLAKKVLDKMCQSNNLAWTIQNGIIQVHKTNEPISQKAFEISVETGLIGIPKRLTQGEKNTGNAPDNSPKDKAQLGWEITYLLNAGIGVNDLIQLKSKKANGIFRVSSVKMEGDNLSGDWLSTAKVLELG